MGNFWEIVNEVIDESDIVLEILDARLVDETRNSELEEKIEKAGKILIHVINKIDLADSLNDIKEKAKHLSNCVFISSTQRLGTTILKNKIMELGKGKKVIVGVVGYPNTGKSSVINALSGKSGARTSSTAGFTKAMQKIKASENIMLLDTPGVIPFGEKAEAQHALIGSKNPHDMKDPELAAMMLMKELKGRVEQHYKVEKIEDLELTLENIARKMNKLKKGGIPDTIEASRRIIMEWQRGKIKSLEYDETRD